MAPVTELSTKDKTMNNNFDIKEMISGSTSDVSVSALSKKGFKKVKVLNQEMIKKLIVKAVDRVLETKAADINVKVREKVVKESRQKFQELLKEKIGEARDKTRKSEQELIIREEKIASLRKEVDNLQNKLEGKISELSKLLEEAETLRKQKDTHEKEVEEYKEELNRKARELEDYQKKLDGERLKCEKQSEELDCYQKQLDDERENRKKQSEELTRYQKQLDGEKENRRKQSEELTRYQKQLDDERENRRKQSEELARYQKQLDEERERVRKQAEEIKKFQQEIQEEKSQEEEKKAGASELGELSNIFRELVKEIKGNPRPNNENQMDEMKKSMEYLADRIAKGISSIGGGKGSGGQISFKDEDCVSDVTAALLQMKHSDKLESNIGQVEVKKSKAKQGVTNSLAKLRSMQKRGGS